MTEAAKYFSGDFVAEYNVNQGMRAADQHVTKHIKLEYNIEKEADI